MGNIQIKAVNAQASEIVAATHENGAVIIKYRDGTEQIVPVDGAQDVQIKLTSGEIFTAQNIEGAFAMNAPEDTHDTPIVNANFEAANDTNQTDALTPLTQESQPLMDQLAQELSQTEPQAGESKDPAQSNHGGFNSTFESKQTEGIDDTGALGATALKYGAGDQGDDSSCGCGPKDLEPKLTVEGQQLVYEDGSVQVNLTAVPDSPNGVLTITIVGIPANWAVSGEGSYDAATLTWTFTTAPGQSFTGGPIIAPPADSDVDLNGLVVTVAEFDSATGNRGSVTTTIDVIVDAVADTPEVSGEDSQGLEDTSVDVLINGAAGDTDGSEAIQKFVLSGVPEGFSLSAGTDTGNGIWELTADQVQGLKLTGPNDFYGDVALTVTIHTAETVTDKDFDLTNNTASASDTLTVSFIPVADPPVVDVDLPTGPECGCPDNDGLVAQVYEDNSVNVNFSATRDDGASPSEFLTVTVSGVDLTKLEAGSFQITGLDGAVWTRVAGSLDTAASFTITLPAGKDYTGSMTFTPTANSDVDLHNIVVTATAHEPASNTTADAVPQDFDVIVDAVADQPNIQGQDVSVGTEGGAANIVITASLNDNDGSESITHYQIKGVPDGFSFNQGQNLGGGVWEFSPAEIQGLKLTPPNADYEGKITLEVHVFNYDDPSDKDFDTTNNHNNNCDTFTVDWEDDEPVAVKDNLGTAYDCKPGSSAYDAFYKGNLIQGTGYHETLINGQPWNLGEDATHSRKYISTGGKDILGKDAVLLTSFTFDGKTVNVPAGGSATIDGYGGLVRVTLHSDGTYEITSDRVGSYSFSYTITDSDGDCSTAEACFNTSVSPLVFDLDGDGVELVSAENGVQFDLNNDGQTEQVGWVSSDDGLLALDANGDGIINNQSELFGNSDAFANGFANLAQYDENGDGVIDNQDGIFNSLVIWRDLNQDGVSDANEMLGLSDYEIASISLNSASVDYQLAGNTVTDESTFTYEDGTTGTLVDAWFSTALPQGEDLYGTQGEADSFGFDTDALTSQSVEGFNADKGDVLDISALLDEGFDPLQDAINDFVFATSTEEDSTILSIDADGSANGSNIVQFAVLQDITTSIDELLNKNALLAA